MTPYILPTIEANLCSIFTLIGRNLPQLSFNTTAFKWLTIPKLCEYIYLVKHYYHKQNYG